MALTALRFTSVASDSQPARSTDCLARVSGALNVYDKVRGQGKRRFPLVRATKTGADKESRKHGG